jgi:hypothetical protein
MTRRFDITTETKGLKLFATFEVDALFDSMDDEQKLLMAELLSNNETIIGYVVEQICGGVVDPRGDGSWSINTSAIEKAREQIVARMGELKSLRDRTLASAERSARHSGTLDGITLAFERTFGNRDNWSDATEHRYLTALDAARDICAAG